MLRQNKTKALLGFGAGDRIRTCIITRLGPAIRRKEQIKIAGHEPIGYQLAYPRSVEKENKN